MSIPGRFCVHQGLCPYHRLMKTGWCTQGLLVYTNPFFAHRPVRKTLCAPIAQMYTSLKNGLVYIPNPCHHTIVTKKKLVCTNVRMDTFHSFMHGHIANVSIPITHKYNVWTHIRFIMYGHTPISCMDTL